MEAKDIISALKDAILKAGYEAFDESLRWWKGSELSRLRRCSRRYASIIRLIPRLPTPLRILDMGTGFGHLAMLIRRLFNYEVICADVETTSGLRKRFQREGIPFYLCDLSKTPLPFPDGCFDVVLFCDALFLIPQDPRKVLKEFNRILKNDGLLILDVPNFLSLYNRIRTLLGKEKTNWRSPYPHHREYTAKELRALLTQTGFFVKKINLCNTMTSEDIYSHLRPMRSLAFYISEALTRLAPSMRDTVIAIGEKKASRQIKC